MADMVPEAVPLCRSNATRRKEIMSAVLDSALIVMDLLKDGADPYAKKVAKRLHYNNLDVNTGYFR